MLVIDKKLSMQSISNQNANGYIVNVLSLPTSTVIEKIFAAPKGQWFIFSVIKKSISESKLRLDSWKSVTHYPDF